MIRAHNEPLIPKTPKPIRPLCICKRPVSLYLPVGKHFHIQCPLHGDVIIRGISRVQA